MLLNRLGLAICTPLVGLAVIGSTVAQEGAILLDRQNYRETVGLGSAEMPRFSHVYVATANAPRWDRINADANVQPFRSPPLRDGFTGSFILDATAADRSEFAARILDFLNQPELDGKRLYLGLTTSPDSTEGNPPIRSEFRIATLDKPADGSKLAFVRFDINEWEVSEGVVSYDIDISYWGKQASSKPDEKTMMAMGEN
jgi:hypothetical protein